MHIGRLAPFSRPKIASRRASRGTWDACLRTSDAPAEETRSVRDESAETPAPAPMDDAEKLARFETAILPHFDAAYRLARWLVSNQQDAEDVTQAALLRAWRFFHGFHGGDARAWLLAIVRNAAYTRLKERNRRQEDVLFDEDLQIEDDRSNPATLISAEGDCATVRSAIESLPPDYREMITLREIEGLSYQSIAELAGIPIGTVMSRLARGRALLRKALARTWPPQTG